MNDRICRDPCATQRHAELARMPSGHADERAMYDRLRRWLCGSGEADEVALGVGEVGDHQI
jgi:hypothetical protein